MRSLEGKRVLITGGAQGIGRQLALTFAKAGCEIILADLNVVQLPEAAKEVRLHGRPVSYYPVDVTDDESIFNLRDRIHEDLGPIDVLINNAGLVFGGAFLDVPLAKHRLTYDVNTLGLMSMTHAFLPDLISRPTSHLVNIASASGFIGLPYGSTYASSKWAVIGFSESIRLELAELGHRNVQVTTVCPSYVNTTLFTGAKPPRTTKFLQPDYLARQVLKAVQRDRPLLLTPRVAHLTPLLSGMLPRRWFDRIGHWFGVGTTMRDWRGRPGMQPADKRVQAAAEAEPAETAH